MSWLINDEVMGFLFDAALYGLLAVVAIGMVHAFVDTWHGHGPKDLN